MTTNLTNLRIHLGLALSFIYRGKSLKLTVSKNLRYIYLSKYLDVNDDHMLYIANCWDDFMYQETTIRGHEKHINATQYVKGPVIN